MKKPKKRYCVNIQFEVYEFYVEATSKKEAREKALKKLERKSLSSMLNKKQTFVDED